MGLFSRRRYPEDDYESQPGSSSMRPGYDQGDTHQGYRSQGYGPEGRHEQRSGDGHDSGLGRHHQHHSGPHTDTGYHEGFRDDSRHTSGLSGSTPRQHEDAAGLSTAGHGATTTHTGDHTGIMGNRRDDGHGTGIGVAHGGPRDDGFVESGTRGDDYHERGIGRDRHGDGHRSGHGFFSRNRHQDDRYPDTQGTTYDNERRSAGGPFHRDHHDRRAHSGPDRDGHRTRQSGGGFFGRNRHTNDRHSGYHSDDYDEKRRTGLFSGRKDRHNRRLSKRERRAAAAGTATGGTGHLNSRPSFGQWLKSIWLDIITIIILGAIGLGVYFAHPAPSRTFPVYFQDGEIVYPEFGYPLRHEIVPIWAAALLAVLVPVVVILFCQIRVRSFWDASNGIIGLLYAVITAAVFQVFCKWLIGGLRPHFLSVCKPQVPLAGQQAGTGLREVYYDRTVCSGKESEIDDSLESFPSGHTTAAFAGFVYLYLYLNAKLKVFSNHHSPLWKLVAIYAPILGAVLIGGSLTIDEYHNFVDIVAGALIGTTMAFSAYRMVYAAIWDWRFNHIPLNRTTAFRHDSIGSWENTMWTRRAGWGGGSSSSGGLGRKGRHHEGVAGETTTARTGTTTGAGVEGHHTLNRRGDRSSFDSVNHRRSGFATGTDGVTGETGVGRGTTVDQHATSTHNHGRGTNYPDTYRETTGDTGAGGVGTSGVGGRGAHHFDSSHHHHHHGGVGTNTNTGGVSAAPVDSSVEREYDSGNREYGSSTGTGIGTGTGTGIGTGTGTTAIPHGTSPQHDTRNNGNRIERRPVGSDVHAQTTATNPGHPMGSGTN